MTVEDGGGRVADATEDPADGACGLVAAGVAATMGRLACAKHWSEGCSDDAHDLAERDIRRSAREQIAAVRAPPTVQDTVVLEVEQDELEELLREIVPLGDIRDQQRLARRPLGQGQQGAQRILGLLR